MRKLLFALRLGYSQVKWVAYGKHLQLPVISWFHYTVSYDWENEILGMVTIGRILKIQLTSRQPEFDVRKKWNARKKLYKKIQNTGQR